MKPMRLLFFAALLGLAGMSLHILALAWRHPEMTDRQLAIAYPTTFVCAAMFMGIAFISHARSRR